MISSPFNWLLGFGRSSSTSNVPKTTHETSLNQSTVTHASLIPPVPSISTTNDFPLHRNLTQLVDEGQRSSLKTKRELLNNLDQLSTLSFLNSSAGINVQRIQDQFEQIDKTLLTAAVKPKEFKDDTIEQQFDGKLTNHLNDYLKYEREKSLLSMLRMVEDKVIIYEKKQMISCFFCLSILYE